ncbi:MAG TPA: 5-deoxy-glucuronate isomerase [bacterium]|nr:5-deoxy-glucuronate isomerase [bacterium]
MSYLVKSAPRTSSYTRIVAPGTGDLHHLEFGVIELTPGAAEPLATGNREAVVYLLSGAGMITVDGRQEPVRIGPRRDVFTDPPSAVYLPPRTSARLVAGQAGCFAALVSAPSGSGAPVAVVGPGDVARRNVGASNWARAVYNVIDATRGAQRLMVGETINPPGNWSSYPPHKHDVRSASGELPMEEVYFYLTRPAGGFALQMLYTAPGDPHPIDEIYRVESGDLLLIPRGYHPVVAAAGYDLFYLWAMAGDESRYGAWSDDPAYAWVREREREVTPAPR